MTNLEHSFRRIGVSDRLVDRVVSEVEEAIVSGAIEPESDLPAEKELARQLGVSRTVVREAVRMLAARGLVETRSGVGTKVRRLGPGQVTEPISLLLRSYEQGVNFEDLHQVRSILEVEIAGLAAEKATETGVDNLRTIMDNMERSRGNAIDFAAHDADFHGALAEATCNPLLGLLSDTVRQLLKDYLVLVTPHLDPDKHVLPFHYRIVDQVAARNPNGAREAMREHLAQIRKNHERAFGTQIESEFSVSATPVSTSSQASGTESGDR